MPISKAFLIAIFMLTLVKQFFSLSQSIPTGSSTVEAFATSAVILLFFSGLRGKAHMVKICAWLGITMGMLYILSNLYLYLDGQKAIYASSFVGLIQMILGIAIVYKHKEDTQNRIRVSYLMSIIPIGYIVLLAMHNPYPIEANVSMFIIQLAVVLLLFSRRKNPSKKYLNILTGLMFVISSLSVVYSALSFMKGANMNSLEYLAYGVIVFLIALKVNPYKTADSR